MGAVPLNAYTAVIDATAGCAPGDTGLPPALVPIAGVPLLARNLEACLAAGLRKVLVMVAGSSLDEARRLGRRLAPRLLVEVLPATSSDPWLTVRNGLNRAALILPGDCLVEAALLRRMQAGSLPDDGALLAVERGEAALGALGPTDGVLVRGERITAVGQAVAASNGRATGVWIATAALLDEIATARLDGHAEALAGVLARSAATGRLGWVATAPDPVPLRVSAGGAAQAVEERLLARQVGDAAGHGLVELATRLVLRRVVVPLGLSRWTVALAGSGLALAGILLVLLGGWTYALAWPGAALVLLGVLISRTERRLAALHGKGPVGGAWGEALRDDAVGLLFFGGLGVHLSIAARSGELAGGHGLSSTPNVFLVLSLLFAVLVAYARYVVYFDVVRRAGGVHARATFAWWFAEGADDARSWRRPVVRVLHHATWGALVSLGAVAVLVKLPQVAFLAAVAGAVLVFALALLHQIQRGDL